MVRDRGHDEHGRGRRAHLSRQGRRHDECWWRPPLADRGRRRAERHPAIVESAATEVRVKAVTTVIAAFYVSNASVETTDLERFVAGRLARYKCPRIYARVEAIPKGANNKLLRQVLRKSYEETLSEA
jgi:hypothetical protein